jgi:DNA mismatch repair protein MutS
VAALVTNPIARMEIAELLDGMRDIERLAAKTAASRVNPRELRHLGSSLGRLGHLQEAVARAGHDGLLGSLLDGWDACDDIAADILAHLVERPPWRRGFHLVRHRRVARRAAEPARRREGCHRRDPGLGA